MEANISPFLEDVSNPDAEDAELLLTVARQDGEGSHQAHPDEQLGLARLGALVDTVKMAEGVSWRQFALSARPRPFKPAYLMLISKGQIPRTDMTDEVFEALGSLLQVSVASLQRMFTVVEVGRQGGFVPPWRALRIRISAPLDSFLFPRPVAAALGETAEDGPEYVTREDVFEEAGLRVSYSRTPEGYLVVSVEPDPDGGNRVPNDLMVSLVSTSTGSVKAGPFQVVRGRAECGQVDWDPLDRLVIERP